MHNKFLPNNSLKKPPFYPGGSQADARAKGFSWLHNYWCNLLNEKGINGELNRGRPFAQMALLVLSLTLLSFWAVAAHRLPFSQKKKHFVLTSGLASLVLLPFLVSAYHDTVINLSGALGLISMIIIYAGLYKEGWYGLFSFGVFNLALVALNNYIYYTTSLYYLPLVQKFTFASFLLWVCLVTIKLYRRPQGTT